MIRRSGQPLCEPAEGLVAVAGRLDLEAVGAELIGEQDEQVRVVVDDEDPGRGSRARRVVRSAWLEYGRRVRPGRAGWTIGRFVPDLGGTNVLSGLNDRAMRQRTTASLNDSAVMLNRGRHLIAANRGIHAT